MSIRFIKLATIVLAAIYSLLFSQACSAITVFGDYTYSGSRLTGAQSEIFPQNNLTFWNPYECDPKSGGSGGGSSISISGGAIKEKMWCAFIQRFSAEQTAGIMANSANEGGLTEWETGVAVSDGQFINGWTWDKLYNNCYSGSCSVGVGLFGFTWYLSEFLHFMNEKTPDLMKYFEDPQYSVSNEELLSKIGESDFNKLMAAEIEYFYKELDGEIDESEFKAVSNPADAGYYIASHYERCQGCGCDGCGGSYEAEERAADAQKVYDDMKDTSCSSSSTPSSSSTTPSSSTPSSSDSTPSSSDTGSSGGTISGSDITWIGDSYSVQADNKGLVSSKFSGVDIGPGSNNTSSSYIQGSKFVSSGSSGNPSCLSILDGIISSGNLRKYLVFACGTNGGWSDSDIAEFQDKIKDKDVNVVVVTSKIPGNDYADSNSRLKAMADSNSKITLADWTTVYDASYFDSDPEKIHPLSDPGYEKWIGVIESALGASNNCTTHEGDYPQYFQETDHTCGQASMAMLATAAAGKDISESDVIRVTGGDSQAYANTIGSGMAALDKKVGDEYGFTVESVDNSGLSLSEIATKMQEYLDNGYMIHMSGEGCTISPTCETHYVGIFKLDGDKALLADSSSLSNREVNLKDYILSGYHGDAFSAIKGSGGSGTCVSNGNDASVCDDGSGSGGSGSSESYNGTGLTDEQADRLATNYNNNTDNWASKAGAGLFCEGGDCASAYSNCSLMSAFFVEMFTSVGTGQAWSGMYGGNVVNVLSGMGFSTGSEPKAFSVFSCGPSDWGHTGVVVRVDGDSITTVEAGYPNMIGQRSNMSICSGMGYGTATYAYLNDKMDTQKLMDFINR